MREFAFEQRFCAHLESTDSVVARQVGASVGSGGGHRIVDVVAIESGPEFEARATLTAETIPRPVLESDARVGEWRPVTRVFDCRPDRARDLAERAVEVGVFERARRGGHDVVRQVARYPDWIGRVRGFENKPDLGTPGDLATQLRKDVSLGLLDEVVLVTGSYVTRAHLNRLPDEVGVWRFRPDETEPVEVVREPETLDAKGWGLQVLDRHAGRTDVRPVSPAGKAAKRRALAERAYGKGWRVEPPACANATVTGDGLPHCGHFDRVVDPGRECGAACPARDETEPPAADLAALRDARTAWRADPEGLVRRQAGLDRFGD